MPSTKYPDPEVGQKFGRLTVTDIYRVPVKSHFERRVDMICECGESVHGLRVGRLYATQSTTAIAQCKQCAFKIGNISKRVLSDSIAKGMALNNYRFHARKRNLTWDISNETFFGVVEQPCVYCGQQGGNCYNPPKDKPWQQPYKYTGLDRIDSNTGYVVENIQPCCILCNRSKTDMSEDSFFEWIKRIIDKCPERFT